MVEQSASGGYTQIVYDPTGSKLAVMSGQTLQKAFVPLPGGGTAVYNSSGLAYYRHPDWLGSSRLASSPSRTMYSDIAYGPFGEPYAQAGTPDLSFTGQNSDTAGGSYDSLFREYSIQGRWPSPDPAGLAAAAPTAPQSWNRYAYVGNSPLNGVDPTGLVLFEECWGGLCPDNAGGGDGWDPFGPVRWLDSPGVWGATCPAQYSGCSNPSPGVYIGWTSSNTGTIFVQVPYEDSSVGYVYYGADFSLVASGGGGGNSSSSWLWTATKSFFTFAGGRGNKPTCAEQALKQIASDLNPFAHQGAEIAGQATSQAQMARALQYAASRPNAAGGIGLICPQCSSVFRGMMSKAEVLGELGTAYLALEVSKASVVATVDVSGQARNGECAAVLPVF
jgi:RHS repeat-associated protein